MNRAVDRLALAKTVFHALTYNADVPQTSEQQKAKKPPPGTDAKIKKYQEFRERHDAAWQGATAHPVSLYRFFGLNADDLVEVFGDPPEPEVPEKDGKLLDSFLERLEAKMGGAG